MTDWRGRLYKALREIIRRPDNFMTLSLLSTTLQYIYPGLNAPASRKSTIPACGKRRCRASVPRERARELSFVIFASASALLSIRSRLHVACGEATRLALKPINPRGIKRVNENSLRKIRTNPLWRRIKNRNDLSPSCHSLSLSLSLSFSLSVKR